MSYPPPVPEDAPVGTYFCTPCDDFHYPGELCGYYDFDPEDEFAIEEAIADKYPEWSGSTHSTYPWEEI